ncbi:MAG: hypothetical protein KGV50_02595 [Gammaproteobacteria bacterium]|nr:hypothetical protein [Gammaproteobacteria bacterium]
MTLREQIVEKIKAEDDKPGNQLFIEVADAGQFDDALKNRTVTEACYVIKLDTTANTKSDYYQVITERYQVVTMCQNLSDPLGRAAGDVAEHMQKVVFNALSGFVAKDENGQDINPMLFNSGGLIDMSQGLHVWSDIYSLSYTQSIIQGENNG